MPRRPAVLLALVALLAARPGSATAQGAAPVLAFTNITLVDVVSGNLQPASTVVVSGRRIAAVGRTGRVAVPAGARLVDATGKFMIPGLWDMHVHSAYTFFDAIFPPLYIANGVTGVREMFGDLAVIAKWRAKAQASDTAWPRIVGSGHIDANPLARSPSSRPSPTGGTGASSGAGVAPAAVPSPRSPRVRRTARTFRQTPFPRASSVARPGPCRRAASPR